MRTPVEYAIIAALPREVKGLVGQAKPATSLLHRGVHLYHLPEAVVVTAGMGESRASFAFAAALSHFEPSSVISIGLAGGCSSRVAAGAVFEADLVIHAQTGERFRCETNAVNTVPLVTTAAIAGRQEKARLAQTYAAGMVDMEAAVVARLAAANGLPFRAIKAISDAHDFELASLSRFASPHGQFRTAAFAMHTALRPHHWRRAAHLGRTSERALKNLHGHLRTLFGTP